MEIVTSELLTGNASNTGLLSQLSASLSAMRQLTMMERWLK